MTRPRGLKHDEHTTFVVNTHKRTHTAEQCYIMYRRRNPFPRADIKSLTRRLPEMNAAALKRLLLYVFPAIVRVNDSLYIYTHRRRPENPRVYIYLCVRLP